MTGDLAGRRGIVSREDDGRQRLKFRRSWPDPIEESWSALTETERLARWIGVYDAGRRRATGTRSSPRSTPDTVAATPAARCGGRSSRSRGAAQGPESARNAPEVAGSPHQDLRPGEPDVLDVTSLTVTAGRPAGTLS